MATSVSRTFVKAVGRFRDAPRIDQADVTVMYLRTTSPDRHRERLEKRRSVGHMRHKAAIAQILSTANASDAFFLAHADYTLVIDEIGIEEVARIVRGLLEAEN